MSLIRHLPCGFTAAFTAKDLHVEFNVYRMISRDPVAWNKRGEKYPDPTEELAEAEIFLHGFIKWDGCSNWHFDEQDAAMIHFCGVEEAAEIGELFRQLYAIARETIEMD